MLTNHSGCDMQAKASLEVVGHSDALLSAFDLGCLSGYMGHIKCPLLDLICTTRMCLSTLADVQPVQCYVSYRPGINNPNFVPQKRAEASRYRSHNHDCTLITGIAIQSNLSCFFLNCATLSLLYLKSILLGRRHRRDLISRTLPIVSAAK